MNEELIKKLTSDSNYYPFEIRDFFYMLEKRGYEVVQIAYKEVKDVCRAAGVIFVGVQEFKGRHLIHFNHTSNISTLTLWLDEGISVERIRKKVEESAEKYMGENGSNPNDPRIGDIIRRDKNGKRKKGSKKV